MPSLYYCRRLMDTYGYAMARRRWLIQCFREACRERRRLARERRAA